MFSFPALVVGSIAPDVGYFFGRLHLDQLSHRFLGSFVFSLPMGLIILALTYGLRPIAIRKLPEAHQPKWLKRPWPPLGTPLVILASLLVGAWSHLFFDSFTHKNGWFVERIPALDVPLGSFEGHTLRVCGALWYGFSFVGVALVFLAFRSWKQQSLPAPRASSTMTGWRDALLVAGAVLPIELVHHLFRGWEGMLLVAFMTLLLVLLVVRNIRVAH